MRLKEYDYSQVGWYFITICAKRKTCYFGNVDRGEIILSKIGIVAGEHLLEVEKHFSFVVIDEYVIMPNHIHAIIGLQPVGAAFMPPGETPLSRLTDLVPRSLSLIVQQYKSGITRWCRTNGFGHFTWQRGFYEHVMRNEDDLDDIREHIMYNPAKWNED